MAQFFEKLIQMIFRFTLFFMILLMISSDFALASLPKYEHPINKIILITLDGVRWQDLYEGNSPTGNKVNSPALFPNIYYWFVQRGMAFGKLSEVRTANLAHVSLPGYLEIMSGHPSFFCFNNQCGPNQDKTLLNKFNGNAAVFASWDLIDHVIDDSAPVNTGRSHRNLLWQNLKLPDDKNFPDVWGDEYRSDIYTGNAAMDYYTKHHPQFLWTSFGDTDEYAHAGDYPGYIKSLQWADQFIGALMSSLPKDTTVIVSPDHGRGRDWRHHGADHESGRTWILMGGNKVSSIGFIKTKNIVYQSNIYPTVMSIKDEKYFEGSLLGLSLRAINN